MPKSKSRNRSSMFGRKYHHLLLRLQDMKHRGKHPVHLAIRKEFNGLFGLATDEELREAAIAGDVFPGMFEEYPDALERNVMFLKKLRELHRFVLAVPVKMGGQVTRGFMQAGSFPHP
ncbi:MAG: hypothetical protein AAB515_03435 [Patescibacteria group bacterium]